MGEPGAATGIMHRGGTPCPDIIVSFFFLCIFWVPRLEQSCRTNSCASEHVVTTTSELHFDDFAVLGPSVVCVRDCVCLLRCDFILRLLHHGRCMEVRGEEGRWHRPSARRQRDPRTRGRRLQAGAAPWEDASARASDASSDGLGGFASPATRRGCCRQRRRSPRGARRRADGWMWMHASCPRLLATDGRSPATHTCRTPT